MFVWNLTQYWAATDPENGSPIVSDADMKKTYGVGYSINVLSKSVSGKFDVKATSPLNHAKLIKALKSAGESDALYSEGISCSRSESMTGNSTPAIANQLAVNAGIEVGIGAFKLSVSAGYGQNSSSTEKKAYAMEEIQHVVGSRYLRKAMLQKLVEDGDSIFQMSFYDYLEKFKQKPDDEVVMKKILDTYGTHIVTRGTLGGELRLSMEMSINEELKESDVHAALNLGVAMVKLDGKFNMNDKQKKVASNTTISLTSFGGTNAYAIMPGTTFESFVATVKDEKKLGTWAGSIKEGGNLALIEVETLPIYELMPTEELKRNLRNYLMTTYQNDVFKEDPAYDGLNLFRLIGYDGNFDSEISAHIPALNLDVVAIKSTVAELLTRDMFENDEGYNQGKDELSIVIYSGESGNVDYDRGFFIGSPTRKPAKITKNRKGELTIERFEDLKVGAITSLYVDVTGDITIAPKTETDLYQTVCIGGFISQNTKLTGKITGSLSVSDGVTLTLAGVDISGSIKFQGNGQIVLADGSQNVVKAADEEQAGITASGKLIIKGDGELIATGGSRGAGIGCSQDENCGAIEIVSGNIIAIGGEYAAGIGGASSKHDRGCGDISISGGNIVAEGGKYGTGIGAGYSSAITGSYCGNIMISGGTIEAKGGNGAAAIGTGYAIEVVTTYHLSKCGDIHITAGITHLTVTKGKGAKESIGKGGEHNSSCGTITIEDPFKITYL